MIRLAGGAGGGSSGPATVITTLSGGGAGNYITASAVPVAVDAVNLAVALTTPPTQIIIIWVNGSCACGGLADYDRISIAKDGAPVAQILMGGFSPTAFVPIGLNYSEVGDGSSHVWALYWQVTGGSGEIANDSAVDTPFIEIMQVAAT